MAITSPTATNTTGTTGKAAALPGAGAGVPDPGPEGPGAAAIATPQVAQRGAPGGTDDPQLGQNVTPSIDHSIVSRYPRSERHRALIGRAEGLRDPVSHGGERVVGGPAEGRSPLRPGCEMGEGEHVSNDHPDHQPPADLLATCGFAAIGDPPTMTLDVLGRAVHVTIRGDQARVEVEVRHSVGQDLDAGVLEAAGLRAPGDTELVGHDGDLIGRRTLVAPSPRVLHDAVYELGKCVVALVGAPRVSGTGPTPETAPIDLAKPGAVPTPAASAPAQPAPDDGRYWCFVDQPTEVHAAPGSAEVVALLMPGTWYPATHDDGVWVHVQHPSGAEGVVLHQAVTRA
jgi:hypothetical protein